MRRLFLFAIFAATLAAGSEIEFVGLASNAGSMKFAFRDPATGNSRWIGLGGIFGDYTLASYDSKAQTAELKKNNTSIRVRLVAASVPHDVGSTAPITTAQARKIFMNLRQLAVAGAQYCLENGKVVASFKDMVGPGRFIETLPSIAGEDYSGLTYDSNNSVFSVITASGDTVTADPWHNGSANKSTFHIVQPGDTGSKIARALGLTISELVARNEGVNFARLHVGDLLRVRQ